MTQAQNRSALGAAIALGIAALVCIRIFGLIVSPAGLGADEAQYWRWAQELDWGYYSKPPLIAWLIAATTQVFGDAEWAVRLAAPVLHGLGALILFRLGSDMFDDAVGAFVAMSYIAMPGVAVSSAVISTDAVLLPLWCLGLWSLWRLRSGGGWIWAITLGGAVGLGFLAKYAMSYFLIGAALAALVDAPTRRALISPRSAVAGAIAFALVAPHIAWNATHGFETIGHTVDNADWGNASASLANGVRFLTDQAGVFGPIALAVFLAGAGAAVWRRFPDGETRWLLSFSAPVLLIILVQSTISRAHANWAATAYPAASILIAVWLVRSDRIPGVWRGLAGFAFLVCLFIPSMGLSARIGIGFAIAVAIFVFGLMFQRRPIGLLWASIGVNAILAAAFTLLAAGPPVWADNLGRANDFKRVRGWPETAGAVFDAAAAEGATAILVDEREAWHGLDYYGRHLPDRVPVIAWRYASTPKSFAETEPMRPPLDGRVLIASMRRLHRPKMRGDFASMDAIGTLSIPLGGDVERRFKLYIASDFKPQERTLDWEARYAGLAED